MEWLAVDELAVDELASEPTAAWLLSPVSLHSTPSRAFEENSPSSSLLESEPRDIVNASYDTAEKKWAFECLEAGPHLILHKSPFFQPGTLD